jgi:hypothetical protein
VLNKNLDGFDRQRWIGRKQQMLGDRMTALQTPARTDWLHAAK